MMDREIPAPWRIAIERALTLQGDEPTTRWTQLATLAPDGSPAVRTVIFRGFLDDGDTLQFTTDLRSEKVEQITRDPRAEACWVFRESREQFRLAGRLRLIDDSSWDSDLSEARARLWAGLPASSRLAFGWPAPGAPRADPRRFRACPPDPDFPPSTFGLLLLDVESVDHLDLRPTPHERLRYRRTNLGGWKTIAVNP